jgi:mannose-6-phosphate isomerase
MSPSKINEGERFEQGISEENRPWGKFRSFPHDRIRSIKIITINPGEAFSLQYHLKRDEFWIILDEGLEVTSGDQIWRPEKNEEIFIPCKMPHRARCISQESARIMEVWFGESEEADIVRIEDEYGRK